MEKSQTHWYEASSAALNIPFLKEASQVCFVFDAVNLRNLRKSRRISSLKIKEVSQNCCASDIVKSKKLRKSRRIASFSILQLDGYIDKSINRGQIDR